MTRSLMIVATGLMLGCDASQPTDLVMPTDAVQQLRTQGVVASVTGSGIVVGDDNDWFGHRVFTIGANRNSNGRVAGHYNLKYTPVAGEQLAGKVTCLTVEGSTAYLGATVEKHPFQLDPGQELTGVAIEVEDNGVGETPDRISLIFYYLNDPDGPQAYCDAPSATPDAFMLQIDQGNLTVR